jgi:hypothetical protein
MAASDSEIPTMTYTDDLDATSTPPAPAARRHRLPAALRGWWTRLWKDPWTEYLENASCLADLERRMRRWERADRNARP